MASSSSKHLKAAIAGGSSKGGSKAQAAPLSPEVAVGGVQIPIIKSKDNSKQLPVYTAALQRSGDDQFAAEDLDSIQLELETLLSNVALRYRVLKLEYESLDKDDRRNERRSKHATASEKPVSPATSALAAQSSKRKREDPPTVRKPKHTPSSTAKHTKHAKACPTVPPTDDSMDCAPSGSRDLHGHTRDHATLQKVNLPKNDIPNKFWLSVEPYCMPLTNEDLRLLDDLLEQYTGPLVPPIPELGPHYSRAWAEDDFKDIQQSSNPSLLGNRIKQQNSGASRMLKKAEAILDNSVTGPLTQRLVSALMEEQLLQNPSDLGAATESSNSNSSTSENTNSTGQINYRSLMMMRNGVGIEKRVKKELVELGILDLKDFPNHEEDEIHTEIKRLLAELTSVSEYNSTALKRLHESATEEIKRLEIKRKLDTIDQEILETYKRTMQNKTKRKVLSPDEQQEIFRLTAEQKALSDQLERSQAKTLTYE